MEEENKVVEKTTEEDSGMNVYELAYLFIPTITEEKILGNFGDLKSYLEKKGAVCIQEELPKLIPLAYEMSRVIENKKTWFSEGYFGFIKFLLDPSAVLSIETDLRRDESIIRFLIVKTVKENTLAPRKMHRSSEGRKQSVREEVDSEKPLATKEEIDAQIDALVVDQEA